MLKKAFSFALMMLCVICMSAQTPLPLNPKVKHGVLPNGLTYYVLHNEEPKGKANFYIAQKVGSALENEQQLGLAHFLEHMAFNGTTHYPGKDMLNYLQNNGIRFGADINAYTSIDETVYNINNVPASNQALMDSVLLALRDWSCDILLLDEEIDAERKVIQEEWRSRNNASGRMLENALPVIYSERAYQHLPIGTMDVVMNFPYQTLRDYYDAWYRPDQQGIIVVGDFDADAMEQKIVALFSDVTMPENAPERVYTMVSDNEEPIFYSFSDPEMTSRAIRVYFKQDAFPKEYNNTMEAYLQEVLIGQVCSMINNRLNEASQKTDCPFSGAYVSYDDFLVSTTKDAFEVVLMPKGDNYLEALQAVMEIVATACKTGFSDSELQRVNDEMLSSMEKHYNERDKTNSEGLARELIRAFVDNEAAPGIETEYEMVKSILPMIPVAAYNEIAAAMLTPNNQVVWVSGSDEMPSKEMTVGVIENALNREYEAYVDEVITEPLIAKLPKKGKVKSSETCNVADATVLTLSNGAKVIVKTTDFKDDEIIFKAVANFGMQNYPASQAINLSMIDGAFEYVKFGPFDNIMLGKYLAGKNAYLNYDINRSATSLSGGCAVKDLPVLMELIYTAYTNLHPDKEGYESMVSKVRPILENQEKDPQFHFTKALKEAQMVDCPMNVVMDVETLDKANYDQMFDIVTSSLANAADYTFIFIGNVDVDTLKPYLEQYVASLPSKKKAQERKVLTPMEFTKGHYVNSFEYPMDSPTTYIYQNFNSYNLDPTIGNSVLIDLLGDIVDIRFTEIIREKEGAAYSPSAWGQYIYGPKVWMVNDYILTNAEQRDRVLELTSEIFNDLCNNGATAEEFNKVKGAALSQYENNLRTNSYWMSSITTKLTTDVNVITDGRKAIEDLTLDDFNARLKGIYNGQNFIEVIMTGVPKE